MSSSGLEPGPSLGAVLSQLDEAQAVGEIETRAEAIEYAKTRVTRGEPLMTDATLMSAVFVGIIAGFYFMFMRPGPEGEREATGSRFVTFAPVMTC